MNGFIGTRGERQWLRAVRRIGEALERIADQLEARDGPAAHPDDPDLQGHDRREGEAQ